LRSMYNFSWHQTIFWFWLLILISSPLASRDKAQPARFSQYGAPYNSANATQGGNRTIPALLISDIHFDPFHDPAKARQLVDAPVGQWRKILSDPPSPNQQKDFAALQDTCHPRRVDTPYALLQSSLKEMQSRQPDAKFITVSGDLISHDFPCMYNNTHGMEQSKYQAFVLKTLCFVMTELRQSFRGVPVYVALGNNDTTCKDYSLDAGSDFLAQTGRIVAEGLPPSQQQQARAMFAKGGYYSVMMEAPMHDTKIIVVNDVFLSPEYRTCDGGIDSHAITDELAWLKSEFCQARRLRQNVWVMGHIPPGVDPYETHKEKMDSCGNREHIMFLSSDKLADLLIDYADVIRLGVFGHSHMDEMRLLERQINGPLASSEPRVAIKVVPSISPFNGNNPAFTVAHVDPTSAALQNYEVFEASNQTGIGTRWSREYAYAEKYHKTNFSPLTVKELIAEFEMDRNAKTEASKNYVRYYSVGNASSELKPYWPQYVCAQAYDTDEAFNKCVCSIGQ